MTDQPESRIREFRYRVPRFPGGFHFVLQVSDPKPRLLDARCTDISADGLAAKVVECLRVGTQVALVLAFPGESNTLRIAGRVSHLQNGEHGIAFIFASPQERELVQKYLASVRARAAASPR